MSKINHSAEKRILKRRLVREFLHKKDQERYVCAASMTSEKFYRSKPWLDLRYRMLVLRGNRCNACGRGPKDGAIIQIDHIRPRYIYPELAFDPSNLQILCSSCNTGKGIVDKTDWIKRR